MMSYPPRLGTPHVHIPTWMWRLCPVYPLQKMSQASIPSPFSASKPSQRPAPHGADLAPPRPPPVAQERLILRMNSSGDLQEALRRMQPQQAPLKTNRSWNPLIPRNPLHFSPSLRLRYPLSQRPSLRLTQQQMQSHQRPKLSIQPPEAERGWQTAPPQPSSRWCSLPRTGTHLLLPHAGWSPISGQRCGPHRVGSISFQPLWTPPDSRRPRDATTAHCANPPRSPVPPPRSRPPKHIPPRRRE
mmetsp:Transcript_37562/g.66938  ORF Transcript_37562/g.66938 Transcript_37562/m.66938 type:complete len:244 (+) Transcript_37562:846-1577(+)